MLQSCGTSSLRHAESLNEGFSAPEASPLKKSQPASNETVVREVGRTLEGEDESAMVPIKQRVISFSILVFVGRNEFRGNGKGGNRGLHSTAQRKFELVGFLL